MKCLTELVYIENTFSPFKVRESPPTVRYGNHTFWLRNQYAHTRTGTGRPEQTQADRPEPTGTLNHSSFSLATDFSWNPQQSRWDSERGGAGLSQEKCYTNVCWYRCSRLAWWRTQRRMWGCVYSRSSSITRPLADVTSPWSGARVLTPSGWCHRPETRRCSSASRDPTRRTRTGSFWAAMGVSWRIVKMRKCLAVASASQRKDYSLKILCWIQNHVLNISNAPKTSRWPTKF